MESSGSFRPFAANLLTSVRLVASPIFAWSVVSGRFRLGALLFLVAAASDVADGWLARRMTAASEAGRWFDHLADIVFLLVGFGALVRSGLAPLWVPLAIGAAFAFYVGDSIRRSRTGSLIGSRLGHLSGILNYGLLGTVVIHAALGGGILPAGLLDLGFVAVPFYSAAAVVARFLPSGSRNGIPDG